MSGGLKHMEMIINNRIWSSAQSSISSKIIGRSVLPSIAEIKNHFTRHQGVTLWQLVEAVSCIVYSEELDLSPLTEQRTKGRKEGLGPGSKQANHWIWLVQSHTILLGGGAAAVFNYALSRFCPRVWAEDTGACFNKNDRPSEGPSSNVICPCSRMVHRAYWNRTLVLLQHSLGFQ